MCDNHFIYSTFIHTNKQTNKKLDSLGAGPTLVSAGVDLGLATTRDNNVNDDNAVGDDLGDDDDFEVL